MSKSGLNKLFAAFPILSSNRFLLREIKPADATDLFLIYSDPDVMEFYDMYTVEDQQQVKDLIDRWREHYDEQAGIRWGITRTGDERIIGTIGLRVQSEWKAALGYDLTQEHWGKGIMTEALTAVVNFTFGEVEFERIEALVVPGNTASEALLKKLGFKKEGLLRHYAYFKNAHQDLQCFSLLRSEWNQ